MHKLTHWDILVGQGTVAVHLSDLFYVTIYGLGESSIRIEVASKTEAMDIVDEVARETHLTKIANTTAVDLSKVNYVYSPNVPTTKVDLEHVKLELNDNFDDVLKRIQNERL